MCSVGIGLAGGSIAGWIIRHSWFHPPSKLYNDAEYWWTEEDEEGEDKAIPMTMLGESSSQVHHRLREDERL